MHLIKSDNIKLILIKYLMIIIILISNINGQYGYGFNDQLYSGSSIKTTINNNNYQYQHNNNNNNYNTNSPIFNINSNNNNDDLENKFVIDVKRNKDGKLEPLVRKTSTSSLSSISTSSYPIYDINTRLDKPTKNSGIIHFPSSDYSSTLEYPSNTIILQQYQLQQQQFQQQQDQRKKTKILIPKCNSNDLTNSFCTEVDNYPLEIVAKQIEQDSKKFEAVFGEDLLPEPQTEISQRIDPDFGEETLCSSRERLIFPQAGMTKDNNWSFIINHQNYTQGIRIEECINTGKPCLMSENFPNGYKTECKQKFIYRSLLSMNEQGIIKKDLFQLPSCCKCYIKSSF